MQTPAPRALALRTTGVTYPGSAEHIRTVRADLRPILRDCPMADDVILCASELAANAALHSHSRLPGGTFTVHAKLSPGDYVWVAVEDDGGPCCATRRSVISPAQRAEMRGDISGSDGLPGSER
jgi:anti-sigma regulatory factor (Ser/Thr protein kinase)